MTPRTPSTATGRRLALATALAAVAIQLPIYDRWFGLLDEGYMLSLAADVRRGQVLYRDVYVDAPFPAAFHVLAAWFALLGTSIWAERVLAVVLFAVFAAASVRLATLLVPAFAAGAFAVLLLCYRIWAFPHWHVYSYSSLAVTLLALATLVVATAGLRPARWRLLGAGLLAGATVLSKQDYGLACTGALGLYLLLRLAVYPEEPDRLRRSFQDGLVFGLGAALVVGPVLAAIAAAGAWDAFVYQTVVSPLTSTRSGTYVELPPLLPLWRQDPALRAGIGSYFPAILQTLRWDEIAAGPAYRTGIAWDLALKAVFYGPYGVWWTAVAWWGLQLARGRGRPDALRLLVLAYAGGFLLAFNTPRDWVHLMMIYPPAMLLGCVLASDAAARLRALGRAALA
ncbi:MAG TPA: hypothetical protein VNO26_11610, partial [Candidatus Limnocylindria bacterium]|nr:hypothetical protein [Candidatus Limnocylindria bacterium]